MREHFSRAAECRRLSSVVEEDGEETVETQKSLETESSVELSQWESMRKWSVPVSPEQIGSYSAARRINPRIAAVNPQVFQRYRQSRGSDSSSASGGEPEDNKQETRLEECFSNLTLTAK